MTLSCPAAGLRLCLQATLVGRSAYKPTDPDAIHSIAAPCGSVQATGLRLTDSRNRSARLGWPTPSDGTGITLGEPGWRHLGLMPPREQPQFDLLRDPD